MDRFWSAVRESLSHVKDLTLTWRFDADTPIVTWRECPIKTLSAEEVDSLVERIKGYGVAKWHWTESRGVYSLVCTEEPCVRLGYAPPATHPPEPKPSLLPWLWGR